ncbi:MAG: hypothetical protein V9G20_29740 [Candidatus Promineifilaceae bacterium]
MPGEDLHQRRLAGAVLAHQRVNFTGLKLEARAVQRPDARELLIDIAHFNERRHAASRPATDVAPMSATGMQASS